MHQPTRQVATAGSTHSTFNRNMSTIMNLSDTASADAVLSLKRPRHDDESFGIKKQSDSGVSDVSSIATASATDKSKEAPDVYSRPTKRANVSKAREIRLEQNRKAARESRRRKKVMIEELQRSVIFFSRANGALKQQNDELSRLLMQAQAQVSAIESQKQTKEAEAQQQQEQQRQQPEEQSQPAQQQQQQLAPPTAAVKTEPSHQAELAQDAQSQAQTVATQAMLQSQGFPSAAARAAAQTLNGVQQTAALNATAPQTQPSNGQTLPPMQPGATMQAMANFQQAAAAAMQAAVQGMQGLSGVPVSAVSSPAPSTTNTPHQSFNDSMAAFAMQAAAGQQFFQGNPFVGPMMAWQQQQQQQQQQHR